MGLAEYMIVAQGDEWGVLHDGNVNNRYATKEAAFEAAVAAASLVSYSGGTRSPPKRPGSIGWKPNCTRREVLSTPLRLAFGRRAVTAT